MKKMILRQSAVLLMLMTFSTAASSHQIGGAYAALQSCDWGQYGHEFGWIGTYYVSATGKTHEQFFGKTYCKY